MPTLSVDDEDDDELQMVVEASAGESTSLTTNFRRPRKTKRYSTLASTQRMLRNTYTTSSLRGKILNSDTFFIFCVDAFGQIKSRLSIAITVDMLYVGKAKDTKFNRSNRRIA